MNREEEKALLPGDSSASPFGGLNSKTSDTGSWILLNSSGGEFMLSVDKYTIMNRANMEARDFRIIDPVLSHPSVILIRDKSIVLNLEHLKGIITSEEVLLRNPMDDDISPVVEELRRRLETGGKEMETKEQEYYPFEFRVLDVALEAICSFLSARTTELENSVYPLLDLLTKKISGRNMDHIRKLKSQMTRLSSRVVKVKDEIEKFLDDDEEMAELYLSRKSVRDSIMFAHEPDNGVEKEKDNDNDNDVGEIEMLLEAYFSNIDETSERLAMVKEYIENTEDYINMQLDNRRNQLIKLDLVLRSTDMALNVFQMMTAIYSMNVLFPWAAKAGFAYTLTWSCIITGVLCLALFCWVYFYARCKGLIVS